MKEKELKEKIDRLIGLYSYGHKKWLKNYNFLNRAVNKLEKEHKSPTSAMKLFYELREQIKQNKFTIQKRMDYEQKLKNIGKIVDKYAKDENAGLEEFKEAWHDYTPAAAKSREELLRLKKDFFKEIREENQREKYLPEKVKRIREKTDPNKEIRKNLSEIEAKLINTDTYYARQKQSLKAFNKEDFKYYYPESFQILILGAISLISIIAGVFLFSFRITGNAIGNINASTLGDAGGILIVLGLITGFFCFNKKKK